MPFRRRIRRQTRGKGSSRHSGTLVVASHGPGSVPTEFRIVETQGGTRTIDGSVQSYADERRSDETCNVGDLIKFLNIFIQTGTRLIDNAIGIGWLEWAVIAGKESDIVIPIINIGTQTLGVIANRMFLGQVLLSGNFPTGTTQCNSQTIQIKVPKKYQFLALGDQIRVVIYFRTANSVEAGTNNVKSFISYIYKGYQ